jgi:DNA-binding PadR family transcriptional regulator
MSRIIKGTLRQKILTHLSEVEEASTADLGGNVRKFTSMCSNPGTLATAALLRRMEKEGLVTSIFKSGKNWGRTYWRLRRPL